MKAIPDKFAQWDAAYVGALSPAEHRKFEKHLASCLTCQSAVNLLPTRVCWLRSLQRMRRGCP